MDDPLFSPHWFRAAGLHPRLAGSTRITRQVLRGETWYVLSSLTGERQFRVNATGYRLIGRLDGRLSLQQIWECLVRELGDAVPSQGEVLATLNELTAAGMLHSESAPDLAGILEAGRRHQQQRQHFNPLAIRLPLFNPTRLLDALHPVCRPLFSPAGLLVWLLLVGVGLLLGAAHWAGLTAYAVTHLGAPRNLLWLWLLYPLIKAAHELGHALAIRAWRGEVHECGVTLFLALPMPYVDASASTAFGEKHRRILVAAMGIMVELALAALALLVWLSVADGWLREAAFACLLIGAGASLLVNANPLMRFDGYHVLAELLEIPALGPRGDASLRYLGERWLLGNRNLPPPPGLARGHLPLAAYALASLLYRLLVLAGMSLWLLGKQFLLGLALAVWLAWQFVLRPATQLLRFLFSAPRLTGHRAWALGASATLAMLLGWLLLIAPMPQRMNREAVVWLPETGVVRNEVPGFVDEVLAVSATRVQAGTPLLRLRNPALETRARVLESSLARQQQEWQARLLNQPAAAQALQTRLAGLASELAQVRSQLAQLTLQAPLAGTLALPDGADLPGRYLPRGSAVASLIQPDATRIRAVIAHQDLDLLRGGLRRASVRLQEARDTTYPAVLLGQAPAAGFQLPSPLFGERQGGAFATDPADPDGLRTLAPVVVLEFDVPGHRLTRIGARASLQLEFAPRPLAAQFWRQLRQLLGHQFAGLEDGR